MVALVADCSTWSLGPAQSFGGSAGLDQPLLTGRQ